MLLTTCFNATRSIYYNSFPLRHPMRTYLRILYIASLVIFSVSVLYIIIIISVRVVCSISSKSRYRHSNTHALSMYCQSMLRANSFASVSTHTYINRSTNVDISPARVTPSIRHPHRLSITITIITSSHYSLMIIELPAITVFFKIMISHCFVSTYVDIRYLPHLPFVRTYLQNWSPASVA